MGDKCNMSVRVRIDQIEKFCEVTRLCNPDYFEPDPDGKTADAEIEEVNYGGVTQLQAAARAGIVFTGNHGSGSEYGPGRFVSNGRRYDELACGYDGELLVPATEDGRILDHELRNLRHYVESQRRAVAALDAEKPPRPRRKKAGEK